MVGGFHQPARGEALETNPLELRCFLSITYLTDGRNKPKRDMFNVFSNLDGNKAAFWQILNDIARATIKD